MMNWREVWHNGIAPELSTDGLKALQHALENGDERLIQKDTAVPLDDGLTSFRGPPAAACAIGYCGWQGEGLEAVYEVEEYFEHVVDKVQARLGSAEDLVSIFLDWFDDTPMDQVRPALLEEVRQTLSERLKEESPSCSTATKTETEHSI